MPYLHDKNCAHRWDRGPCDCGAEALNANDHIHTLESDNSALRDRVAELGLTVTLAESAHQDDLQEIESLKDKLREVYRLRGEDPVIAGICNRALA